MKTNAQIRAAQITKAIAFIKRAFKNEEVKPQELDVTDKGTHIEIYAIGNKKFDGSLSDYEISFSIKKGAVTDLSYMSPSVNMEMMVTQNIIVGKRDQIANFGKSCDKTASDLYAHVDHIGEVVAEITKFNTFVHNALMAIDEAARDGEFDFAPANDQTPEKKVPHKQAVANSKAKAAKKAAKPAAKKPAKKETKPAKKAAKPTKKVEKKAAAKPAKKNKAVEKILKATLKKATKKAEAKPVKKVSKVAAKTAAAKKAVAKKIVK